ncbi:MAG: hypothetical protein V1944_00360 [Candidatus Aenigmatarchaeota archaeon]
MMGQQYAGPTGVGDRLKRLLGRPSRMPTQDEAAQLVCYRNAANFTALTYQNVVMHQAQTGNVNLQQQNAAQSAATVARLKLEHYERDLRSARVTI